MISFLRIYCQILHLHISQKVLLQWKFLDSLAANFILGPNSKWQCEMERLIQAVPYSVTEILYGSWSKFGLIYNSEEYKEMFSSSTRQHECFHILVLFGSLSLTINSFCLLCDCNDEFVLFCIICNFPAVPSATTNTRNKYTTNW